MVNPSNQPQSFTAVPTVCTSESQHRAAILAEATIAEINNLGSSLITYRYLSTFLFFDVWKFVNTSNAWLVAFIHKASAASLKVTIRHFTDRINTPDFRTNGTRSESQLKHHGSDPLRRWSTKQIGSDFHVEHQWGVIFEQFFFRTFNSQTISFKSRILRFQRRGLTGAFYSDKESPFRSMATSKGRWVSQFRSRSFSQIALLHRYSKALPRQREYLSGLIHRRVVIWPMAFFAIRDKDWNWKWNLIILTCWYTKSILKTKQQNQRTLVYNLV